MSLLSVLPLRRLRFSPLALLRLPAGLKSLRGGFTLFLLLFVLLQCLSVLVLARLVASTGHGVATAQQLSARQALLDKARMELLTASDNSHRAGIYLMQDQQSGSVDSWKSLADGAQQSLDAARALFARYPAEQGGPLQQNFSLLADGLQEQLKGLHDSNIDAFFMVPMQAFQQQFNDAYYAELRAAAQQSAALSQSTLSSLTNSRNLSLAVSALLALMLLLGGGLLLRGVILPLNRLAGWLNHIATGDLSRQLPPSRLQAVEIRQLSHSVAAMQDGLRQMVGEINAIAGAVHRSADSMAQHSEAFGSHNRQQRAAFDHISQRLNRVAEEVGHSVAFTRHATQQSQDADALTRRCGDVVQAVEAQMRQIVDASGEIAGIVTLLDSISMQTRLLALNAAIESAHAGAWGRSFSVVAKEIGLLSHKSSASTRDIDQLISNTHQHIGHGFSQVQSLEELYQQIAQAVSGVVSQLADLQQNADAQSQRVTAIAGEIGRLNEQVQQSEQLTRRSGDTAGALVDHASRLAHSVSQFVLDRG